MAIKRKHIDKVYSQKYSLHDHKMLVKYFENNTFNEETKLVMKEQWEQFDSGHDHSLNLDHVFLKLFYAINNAGNSSNKEHHLFYRFTSVAAILVFGIIIASSIYLIRKNNTESTQVEFVSNTGFRNHFTLPDGTIGWLGSKSEIKYHIDKNNHRIVDIDGLAFFDVNHRKDQPFIVKTPTSLDIEVLGTRFNVSAYSSENTCEVVLERGSVLLKNNFGLHELMSPNDRIIYNSDNKELEKLKVNTADFLAWTEGKLVLKDISLKDACLKLSRFYNVDFDIKATNIENDKVRLVLENESLDEALYLLSVLTPIKYQVEGRKVMGNNSFSRKKIIIRNRQPM